MKRFFDKVNKTKTCWNWTGAKRKNGYGCIKIDGKLISSHRASWVIHKGEIPDGLWVLHTCDNRLCVNPEHLFLGDRSDNMKDAIEKGRIVMPTPDNPRIHPSTQAYKRGCRCHECKALKSAQYYRNKK